MFQFDFELDEDIVSPPWNPTPAQMAAYKAREIELAKDNIKHVWARFYPRPEDTLHSDDTFLHGFQAVLAEPIE